MPFIIKAERKQFDDVLKNLPNFETKGQLEYAVTYLMHIYMHTRAFKYSTTHDCVYAVHHSADEFRRSTLDIREDQAKESNGDVVIERNVKC